MRATGRLLTISFCFVLYGAAPLLAQDIETVKPDLSKPIREFVDTLRKIEEANRHLVTQDISEESKRTEEQGPALVEAKTTTAAAPQGFAERVNDAIADFLPYFQGAVNAVSTSDDRKSVTLKLNPLRLGAYGNISVSITSSEPQVFKPLLDSIVEPARDAQEKTILSRVSGFSDVTSSLSYAFQRQARSWEHREGPGAMWGRNWDLYKPLMDDLLNGAIQSVDAKLDERIREANAAKKPFEDAIYGYLQKEQAANRLKNIGDSYDLTFAQVVAGIPGFDLAAYEAALKAKIKALYAVKSQTLVWRFSETLPALIDNQPQFVVTGAVRNAHDLVGADLYSITTSYELGLVNFNSVIKEYRRLRRKYQDARAEQGPQGQLKPPTPFEAYRNVAGRRKVLNEDKIVFSATYKTQRAYDVSYDYVETVTDPLSGTEVTVPHMANADLPSAHEVHAQVNWTRFVTPKKTGEATPRVDFSIEYVDVSNDPSRQNRLIGRVTYTLASQGGVGIPLTLTYANHSEFLGEQDRVLSAHVGVSYKVCRNR